MKNPDRPGDIDSFFETMEPDLKQPSGGDRRRPLLRFHLPIIQDVHAGKFSDQQPAPLGALWAWGPLARFRFMVPEYALQVSETEATEGLEETLGAGGISRAKTQTRLKFLGGHNAGDIYAERGSEAIFCSETSSVEAPEHDQKPNSSKR
jgi:hypothetical protein